MTVKMTPELLAQMNTLNEMFAAEELNPDLTPYIGSSDMGIPVLRHPLVFKVPYAKHFNKSINLEYKEKKELLAESLAQKNYNSFVFVHERPYRINSFFEIESLLNNKEYWELLSQIYTDSENIYQCYEDWAELLDSDRKDKLEFMNNEERDFLNNLPDTFIVYRGYLHNESEFGFSWTLDKEKAIWFSNRGDSTGDGIFVSELKIKKTDVFAYKASRNESEIVLLNSEFL
jgi:hypothetical protein